MSGATSSISIPVDLMNPGQFFACCGLFEVTDRLWRGADVCGHFEGASFVLTGRMPRWTIESLISEFADSGFDQLDPDDSAASALRLLGPFGIRLDWWSKPEKDQVDRGGGGQLKTWAGKQSGPLIFGLMKAAVKGAVTAGSPLDYVAAVYDGKDGRVKKKAVSPFYFDSRREATCLDLGFSPDEQGMSVQAFPVVESFALVGLQRFRPFVDDATKPRSFVYSAWSVPLPLVVAAVAASGVVPVACDGSFRFTKPSRGGEYMTMFSRAQRERSKNG